MKRMLIQVILRSKLILVFFVFTTGSTVSQDSAAVMKLPIELVPSTGKQDVLVLYLTGDGGWTSFSRQRRIIR